MTDDRPGVDPAVPDDDDDGLGFGGGVRSAPNFRHDTTSTDESTDLGLGGSQEWHEDLGPSATTDPLTEGVEDSDEATDDAER
jgi:hypothetical protein